MQTIEAKTTFGDIPMEVLMSLPSHEEILRREEAAKAKAALATQQSRG